MENYQNLLTSWITNNCTPEEAEKVLLFLQKEASARVLLQQLRVEFDRGMQLGVDQNMQQQSIPVEVSDRLRRELLEKIAPPVRAYRKLFFRRVAAAVIMILSGGSIYWGVTHREPLKDTAARKKAAAPATAFERPKATITLANGERIVLDDLAGSTLVGQGNIKVVRLADGQIAYEPTAVSSGDTTWHTLTVPEGCKPLQISLADGTKVWMNTASALRYPVAFNGGKRNVTLTGEAYFEVAQDKEKPFTVETQDVSVHVLGTAFDVSSYSDDRQHNVVLVSGRVELATGDHSGDAGHQLRPDDLRRQLKPGDLATYTPGTGCLSIAAVNTEEYISWRKGYLIFKRAPLEEIIRRLSRYYNIQIDMESAAHTRETFSGRLDFQQNFEDIMEMLCAGTPFVYQAKERKLVLKENVNNK